ncbi:MAG: isoprenyl transferase [Oligoflexales bacterium]
MFQNNTQRPPDIGSIRHVAIIMDGNGRWAKLRGKPRVWGHKCGVESVRSVVEGAGEAGLDHLTLFAFSDENWQRPAIEVQAILGLLDTYLLKEAENLRRHGVRLQVVGDTSRLPEATQKHLAHTIGDLQGGSGLTLNVAVSYGSRSEMTDACRRMALDVQKGVLSPEQITTEMMSKYLWTANIPDPDLLIRTSGEQRLSNFLLWQSAYTEFLFVEKHWPDFRKSDLFDALLEFQRRDRRFGKVKELSKKNTRASLEC